VIKLTKPHHWLRPPGPITKGLRIGLLGGSFNPAHEGHLHISEMARKRLNLDYVWWLVATQNPLKPTIGMAPLEHRLSQAAELARHPRILVMDIEKTFGTHYTIDTLHALKTRFPGVNFVWVMGSDNLASFRRWRRWADIAMQVPIAVVMRPGTVLAALHAKPIQRFGGARHCSGDLVTAKPPCIAIIDGRRNKQSSTSIREAAELGEALVHAIPTC
jgi:nicotinate-nucleotide adenylyltransferase